MFGHPVESLTLRVTRYRLRYLVNKNNIRFLSKNTYIVREAAKKILFFSGPTTKRGGGRARPLRKKELFYIFFLFVAVEKKFLMTTKPRGGVKALVVGSLKKELFLRLPLVCSKYKTASAGLRMSCTNLQNNVSVNE